MIKTKNGKVTLKGSHPGLLTDYSAITKALNEVLMENGMSNEDAKKIVKHANSVGMMTKEELEKESKNLISKIMNDIAGRIKADFEEEENADE